MTEPTGALWRAIFESALDGMLLADDDGRYVDANPAACALFGLSRDALIGRRIIEFAAPDYATSDEWKVFGKEGTLRGLFPLVRPDGKSRTLEFSAVANVLPGVHLSVLRDVTEKREAGETRNRLAAIVESSNDAIISKTLQGIITSWNHGAERLFGYAEDEMLGRPITVLFPPERLHEEADFIARVSRGESVQDFDTVRVRKDGSRVEISLRISPIRGAAGEVVGVAKIARDITERRKAEAALRRSEEQLRQAQKMEAIGRLAGGVAHDFNNMLSVILSFGEIMAESLQRGDPMRQDVEEIVKAGTRAAALTRQLLAVSRQQVVEPRVLDLNDVLATLDKMLRRILGEDVELTSVLAPSLGRIRVDPSNMEQVIMNLVINARDAMPRGGKLTLETSNVSLDADYVSHHVGARPGPHVMLAVSDTGMGMDRATQARIFEPFFTTKEKGKGTGLGLATVFGIVQQSQGSVWVYSEPGVGTTFKVYLPRVDGAVDTVRPLPPTTLRGTETVLLVEDEEQVRAVACSILRRYGYQVLAAQNAGEALLLCERYAGRIDLLLTDVVMPQMSGPELAKRLGASRTGMKLLCMSGYTDDSIVRHGVLGSEIAFLQKPITPETLTRKVREVLDAPLPAPSPV